MAKKSAKKRGKYCFYCSVELSKDTPLTRSTAHPVLVDVDGESEGGFSNQTVDYKPERADYCAEHFRDGDPMQIDPSRFSGPGYTGKSCTVTPHACVMR